MSDPFARKGFKVLTPGVTHDLSDTPVSGITPLAGGCVVALATFQATVHPPGGSPRPYQGDAVGILEYPLTEGVFYPIRFATINLDSGGAIAWFD